jgi:hypothetical protein
LIREPGNDFKIVAEHLARRMAVTLQTACNIRRRLCDAGILQQTAVYVPQKLAARFRWIAKPETGESSTTMSKAAPGNSQSLAVPMRKLELPNRDPAQEI